MKNIIKSAIILGVWSLISTGCIYNSSELDQVTIRVQNSSSYDMQNIQVVFPEDEVSYGDILSGKNSAFKEVERAYRYAYIEAVVNGKKLVLQPIDYVGESFLEPGLYTYKLDIAEEILNSDNFRRALSLQLIRE